MYPTASTATTLKTWLSLPSFVANSSHRVTTFVREGISTDGTQFTVPTAGIYIASYNARFDDMNTGLMSCVLRPSVGFGNNGMLSQRGSMQYKTYTFSGTGVINSPANVNYSLAANVADRDSSYFHTDSSFAMYKIEPTEGVYARANKNTITGSGWRTVTSWSGSTALTFGFANNGVFANGVYTVKVKGLFVIGAVFQVSTSTDWVEAGISVNWNRKNGIRSLDGKRSAFVTCA